MTIETLKQVLMNRDGLSEHDADLEIKEARQAVLDGEDPEEVLEDWFGLEPDYIFDIMPGY